MAIFGEPRNFHLKYAFVVDIDGLGTMSFQKFSEPTIEITPYEHYEGGSVIPYSGPARVKYADVTLERGVTGDRAIYDWVQMVIEASSGLGLVNPLFRRNFAITQQDRDGSTLRRLSFFNAFPTEFNPGEWDNTSDDVNIERIKLKYDYWKLIQ